MSVDGLHDYSKEQLIAELINRMTFAGVVLFLRGDVKAGELEPGELVITKSPPLSRGDVEELLRGGLDNVAGLFDGEPAPAAQPRLLAERPPLRWDAGGVIRVGESRVSLDLIVEQYENGLTPDDLVRAYDTLKLPEVYSAIGYYLRHRAEVRHYLKLRREEAESLRIRAEGIRPRISREELDARRTAAEDAHAPAGQ